MQSLEALFEVITARKSDAPEGSYTAYLFREGRDKILKKVGEEAAETLIAAKNGDLQELTNESADLLYHLLVLWANEGLDPAAVDRELARRAETIANKKPTHQVDRNS